MADLPKDRSDIVSLWERNLSEKDREERCQWLYEENPNGRGQIWVASESSALHSVGAVGLARRAIFVRGERVLSGLAADFVVDEAYRGFGPALRLQRALTESIKGSGLGMVYGYPNPKAANVLQRAGFSVLGECGRWVKLLRTEYRIKDYLPFSLLAKVVSLPADALLALAARERSYLRSPEIRLEAVRTLDERFDKLWEVAYKSIPIVCERTSGYLRWRYHYCPGGAYEICTVVQGKCSEMLGYVVYQVRGQVCYVADLLTRDFEGAFDATIAEFSLWMRARKVFAISISVLENRRINKKLLEWNFRKREDRRKVMILLAPGMSPKEIDFFRSPDHWYLIEGDDI